MALRVLHVIHDFLPRHRAGSEIYAHDLCQALNQRHHVTVLTAEYDLSRTHGQVTWRVQDGLPVIELVNNWRASSFEETYRSPVISAQLDRLLDVIQPDVLHIHSLLNLSFDVPAMARARGIRTIGTLHDYTLVCPSGGQLVHRAEDHICRTIDSVRCARCFAQSPFWPQIGAGNVAGATRFASIRQAAGRLLRRAPGLAQGLARTAARTAGVQVSPADIEARLASARRAFEAIDLVVSPSRSLAQGFQDVGLDASRVRVLDHGFVPLGRREQRRAAPGPLRIGYVGTVIWHKGVHILIDAVRKLPPSQYELHIFGDPAVSPEYSADLRAQAQGLPVRFRGEVERRHVRDAYAGVDVAVICSLWPENSPLVIREAFMVGVPVVGARIGGIPDLINEGRNGWLYEPRSSEDLARVLQLLINDRQRVSAAAENLPIVKSMEAHALEWVALYEALLRTGGTEQITKAAMGA
jgi:glycosyltransferase involved in cell wall biosynthesis